MGSSGCSNSQSSVPQALCFMAGANSIFDGDKLLTTPNNERSEDLAMFEALGLKSRPAFHSGGYPAGACDCPRDLSLSLLLGLCT